MTSSTYAKFLRRLNKKTKYNQHERSIELKNEEEMTEEEFHEEIAGMDEEALEALMEAIEGDETLDEVSKQRLGAYIKKANSDSIKTASAAAERGAAAQAKNQSHDMSKFYASNERLRKRRIGTDLAIKKLTKEEFSLEDVVAAAVSKKPVDFREMVEALIESKVAAAIDGYVETAFEAFIVPEEQIDEVSKKRLGAYIHAATKDKESEESNARYHDIIAQGARRGTWKHISNQGKKWDSEERAHKRAKGIKNAEKRLYKEDEDLDIDEIIESLTDDQVEEVLAELEALDLDGLSEEEIAEVSKERLAKYVNKAAGNMSNQAVSIVRHDYNSHNSTKALNNKSRKFTNRMIGIKNATDKLKK